MSKWISCWFHLPEKSGYYLTTLKGCMASIKATWYSKDSNQFYYDEIKPTHWMPLPAPPEKENKPIRDSKDVLSIAENMMHTNSELLKNLSDK